MTTSDAPPLLARIRAGEPDAWQELIDQYEGRLMAFVDSRLRNRAQSEDIVQETFLGFLLSLPNYDERTPLESWLFSIAAYKLTDQLRKSGRRPRLTLSALDAPAEDTALAGKDRQASSLLRSRERVAVETDVLSQALRTLIAQWKSRGEWERLQCVELLVVLGWKNKEVAARLGLSEQTVANHKAFVMGKLKEAVQLARLPGFRLADFWGE